MRSIVTLFALCALTSCGEEKVSLRAHPAVRATPDASVPSGWLEVEFTGDQHGAAGSYYVREKPLFTEWNLVAARTATTGADVQVTVRFNEYAKRILHSYCADQANLKNPLALNVNGRWASFAPLLRPPGDRLTLRGFTAAEAGQLQRYIASK